MLIACLFQNKTLHLLTYETVRMRMSVLPEKLRERRKRRLIEFVDFSLFDVNWIEIMADIDLYQILGVSRGASNNDIKKVDGRWRPFGAFLFVDRFFD